MSDKTEAPTPRKLEEAREDGKVVNSRELNTAAILLAGALLLRYPGQSLVDNLKSLLVVSLTTPPSTELSDAWMRDWNVNQVLRLVPGLGMILMGLLAVGVAVTLAQTGFLWTGKKIGFDFSRLNPISGFQRIFSSQGLVELGKALLKLALVGYVAYAFLNQRASQLVQLGEMDLFSGLAQWVDLASSLAIQIGEAYLLLAAADYGYQRWRFMQSMRMSKDEIKQELKRSEGDPFLRGRIRAQQRKMARSRMMANVPCASVVITNPTHFAVAIKYDPKTMRAPRVLAKGAYLVAQRIVTIARSSGVPIVQNVLVARALYKVVQVDQEIPSELYVAVAEILAFVYKLGKSSLNPVKVT
ncbi:MAG: flagellar biosynthesis protein FlhB [Anaerolineaceae bacterium]|nr:flagellar biosynthesis protein FlhB [Anaerolineaceae bacterium]